LGLERGAEPIDASESDAAMRAEIQAGPDPERARVGFERFVERGGAPPADPSARRLLTAILSSGSFLPELLLADIGGWADLVADPWLGNPKPSDLIFAEVEAATRAAVDFDDFKRRLRLVRRREMLRLGARELGWGTTEEVAVELSGFADACLELSYRYCDAALRAAYGTPTSSLPLEGAESDEPPPAFVVIAMGKLGGQELNFSSDVDIVYFYSTDAGRLIRPGDDLAARGAVASRSLHEYYVELARLITEAIQDVTPEGSIFRVDLRLRPEGRGGPLCNSLAATERYYETFGRTWERQALLRARPCAGDQRLGERILDMLDPFIYPRHIAPSMIDEIRALRGQFRPTRESSSDGFDVKLGTGGIRDVELVVQTLQLVHAGKRRDLRGRSTPHGLRRLEVAGLLSDREARTLAAAYRFWRHVEHRLQLQDGAQTQLIPADPIERGLLARRLGFLALAAFEAHVAARRTEVKEIADTFDDPQPDLPAKVLSVLDVALERTELQARLAELGFADLDATADLIEMVRGRLSPGLIAEAAASPDPDRALAIFRDLTLRGSVGLLALLRTDPQLMRMLANLFGVSERLSRLLVIHPEMWEPLVDGLGEPIRSVRALTARADATLEPIGEIGEGTGAEGGARGGDLDDREEAAARALRRFCAEETLRIGFHDVAGNLATAEVARQLTELAEICVQRGIARIIPMLEARYGLPSTSLTVLGLGSLGAYEMRYGSDLDLVFLYGEDGQTSTGIGHQEFFSRLARRVITSFGAMLEEGRLFSVDTRLRPSGEQGLLVTSHKAFERYHEHEAAGWERVALLRARIVFSTAAPGERAAFEATLARITYERPFDAMLFSDDLRRVRARVEAERGKVPPGSLHLRFDPGGIMDVEFLAALGQVAGGAADVALRTTQTTVALARLAATGWPASLISDYALLRTLAMRIRLLRDRPEDVVGPPDFTPLARSLEQDPTRLHNDLNQALGRVRSCFVQRFP
jgi:[glutamine synthetase] adenylyltransferase / [glutamine synthetase]-adenylyl-L-tyrosine phosphorylase